MQILRGRGLSRGFAIGPAVALRRELGAVYRITSEDDQVEAEVGRLTAAVEEIERELARTRQSVQREVGSELAGIFDAHDLILHDPLFLERIEDVIRGEKVNAEWAVQEVGADLGARFARIETAHLRERGQDIEDVVRYLLANLQKGAPQELGSRARGAIIVADELTPAEALRLGRLGVAGFVLEGGGEGSHTVIVARALSLPLVLGVREARNQVRDGAAVVIDGETGTVGLRPDPTEIAEAKLRVDHESSDLPEPEAGVGPTRTLCGAEIDLLSNIEILDEINVSLAARSDGVGLYRSEFLYIERAPELPTEEEQFAAFERLLCSHAPRPVTIRTFDLGGREIGRGFRESDEANPSLGLRGVRLTLTQRKVFVVQLRALLRAASVGNLRIMVPMVSSVDEVLLFRALLSQVRRELVEHGVEVPDSVPIGAMIEVPGAALIAHHLAKVVDFFAIGTNDLTQYTLAVDRNNDRVAGLYRPLHPAVLRLVDLVVRAAAEAGVEVSICGEIGGDPRATALLLGAGLRQLSMSPRAIHRVRERVAGLEMTGCQELWERACSCATAGEVERLLTS
ncbi:MAG: phosphoenolpyruvate--protein phosphotransferase [Acidobacteria bacterium]|nr:MAG: phosphoenolpyruvate--protein phosphotransferase [Acidobacteriota bacterium]